MGAKVIALRLEEVRGEFSGAVSVVKGKGGGKGGDRDAHHDGLGHDAAE